LYKKARAGEIKEFTGIDAPYEEPLNAELVIDTSENSLEESTDIVLNFLKGKSLIS
jgi:adenylylsulfate kinase